MEQEDNVNLISNWGSSLRNEAYILNIYIFVDMQAYYVCISTDRFLYLFCRSSFKNDIKLVLKSISDKIQHISFIQTYDKD